MYFNLLPHYFISCIIACFANSLFYIFEVVKRKKEALCIFMIDPTP